MNEKKLAAGSALLYAAVNGVFLVLSQLPNLTAYIVVSGGAAAICYIIACVIWVTGIVLLLTSYYSKRWQNFRNAFDMPIVRCSVGLITAIIGLMRMPSAAFALAESLRSSGTAGLVSSAVPLVIALLQLVAGLMLMRPLRLCIFGDESRGIIGIAFLFTLISGVFTILNFNGTVVAWKNGVWFLLFAAVLFAMLFRLGKVKESLRGLFSSSAPRTAVGALTVVSGLFALPQPVFSLIAAFIINKRYSLQMGGSFTRAPYGAIFQIALVLIQIAFGVWLLLRGSKSRKA